MSKPAGRAHVKGAADRAPVSLAASDRARVQATDRGLARQARAHKGAHATAPAQTVFQNTMGRKQRGDKQAP